MSDSVSTPTTASAPEVSNTSETTTPVSDSAPKSNPAPVKEKIKVDGEEEEWSPEELRKWAQMGRSATKRYEEAAKTKKEAESLRDRFKSDPWAVMKELGLDPRQVSEEYLVKILQQEQMTPEERERAEERSELERLKAEKKEREEAEAKSKQQAAVDAEISKLDQELGRALSNSELPKTPAVVRSIAKKLYDAIEADIDMSTEEAVALTEEEFAEDWAGVLAASRNPNRFLPKELSKRLMDEHLSQVKGAPRFAQEQTSQNKSADKPKTISSKDFMKKIMS